MGFLKLCVLFRGAECCWFRPGPSVHPHCSKHNEGRGYSKTTAENGAITSSYLGLSAFVIGPTSEFPRPPPTFSPHPSSIYLSSNPINAFIFKVVDVLECRYHKLFGNRGGVLFSAQPIRRASRETF